jgi:hypothetical protein
LQDLKRRTVRARLIVSYVVAANARFGANLLKEWIL